MSYSVDWISPIYDRTYADVINAEMDRYLIEPKGCYNYSDLNRIENNTKYVMEDMLAREIIKAPPTLAIKMNWKEADIPTRDDMVRIIQNVQLLMSLSNPEVMDDFDIIYESTQFTYALANAIERNLEIMKEQPRLPIAKWLLKINNGIIIENNSSQMFLAENETVNIQFMPSGEDVEFMGFTHWSGNTDDLQYIGNINSPVTTYEMQYHEQEDYVVEITGNYEMMIPRTLKLNGGKIYDEIGGSTRQFFAGNEILILADIAPIGKRFQEWRGTQEGLDNINGGPEPSTSWLVMPDCDVELTSFYINAGKHKVTVDGQLVGWFDYGETVEISYSERGEKYTFLYWSGDTEYLDDIETSSSLKMPDVDVNLSSNWKFAPDQVQLVVNNGTGSGMYDENGSAYITADTPSEGMGFYGWTLDEGYGGFSDADSPSTTYYFGGTNAVVTAHFKPIRSVVLNNINNSGTPQILSVMEDTYFVVNSAEIVGDQILDYWRADNGEKINVPYFTERMGSEDRVFTAVYRNRNTFHLTVNYGDGDGDYLERGTAWVSADPPPSGKQFSHWSRSSDIWSIDSPYSATTYVTIGHDDCYVTANYEDIPDNPDPGGGGGTPVDPPPERPTYHFTVIDGSGDGDYYEGQHVTAYGNEPPNGYEFSHWTENDTIISYYTPYYFYMPANDRTIEAHYKEIPSFTITVINGKTENGTSTGTFKRNSNPTIYMDPAPEGMKFLQWEIVEGVDEDIQHILAETTKIRNLTHNVTVKATYYVPNPDILYILSITDKLGNTTTSNHPVGEQVGISADEPDEGYKFFKWVGDTQYVVDKYSPDTLVNMPPKNISLEMEYRREGFTTVYHVIIYGGELLVDTDPETGEQHWDIEGEFEEGTKVQIRAIDIPIGWRFNGWKNDDDEGKSVSTVNDLLEEETFLTVQDFDITLTRDVIEKDKYAMAITDGEISGTYYEGNPVPIYFNLEDTELTHYTFVRWSGTDTAKLRLFGSSSKFDITIAGTPDYPQTISMPATNIAISAVYTSTHRLLVNGEVHGYYEENTEISISAPEPEEGKRFTYWTGDVSYVDNKYNPNIKVTMPKGAITLVPNYHSLNDNNCIGYSLTSLSGNDTINIEDIVIISGKVDIGFLITDSNGHIFIVTGVTDTTATIMRLTTIEGGGEDVQ